MSPADIPGATGSGDPTPRRSSLPPPQYEAADEISLDDPVDAAPVVLPEPVASRTLRGTGPEPTLAGTSSVHRVGRPGRMFTLWFAANSSLVTVVVGGSLFAAGMSIRQVIAAVLIGALLSAIPIGAATIASVATGRPTMAVSRSLIGEGAALVPLAIAILGRVVVAAVFLWLVGAVVSDLLPDGAALGALSSILAAGALAAAGGVAGYRTIAPVLRVVAVGGGALILAFVALTVPRVDLRVAFTIGDGPDILVLTGAVVVFSTAGLAWATAGGDLARHQRVPPRPAASAAWAALGVGAGAIVLVVWGAVLAASDPVTADGMTDAPVRALLGTVPGWFAGPAVVAMLAGLLAGATVSVYSGGLAMETADARLRRPLATAVVATAAIVLAVVYALVGTDAPTLLRDGATTVAVPVAAWAGVFVARLATMSRRAAARGWPDIAVLGIAVVVGWGLIGSTVAGLDWQGYLFRAAGMSSASEVARADAGVIVAFLVGLLVVVIPARRPPARGSHRTR